MKAFIVYSDYDLIDDKTIVKLFGKLENGQSFASINKIEPYFYIKEDDLKKVNKLLKKYKIEKTNLKNKNEEKIAKISGKNHIELNKLSKAISKTVETYEADIKPHIRFIIDNDLLGTIDISGDYEPTERTDRFYKNPEIKPENSYFPKLKTISIDLESEKHDGNLYCIGIYSEKIKKVFMITKEKIKGVISCSSELDCLTKFRDEIIKIDPDIITGWNVIDFDLAFLQKLFAKHKIPFDIGRTNSNVRLRIESDFFRNSTADVQGRQVLDALNMIRDPFLQQSPTMRNAQFSSYTLEDVSQEILKKGKLLKGKSRHEEISELYKKNQEKLAEYNILDCELAYEILEKTQLVELAIERSKLTGLTLDKLNSSIASFDSLYIREATKSGYVSPTTHFTQKQERIKGGFVQSAKSGIYHNVLVMDFKSLYPSIIKTFNIDPVSYLEKPEKGAIESPNKAYFKNQLGILPKILEKLHQAREKAKKEERELANYAIKVIQNSFFGVLASPNCRYFSLEVANAITYFGQFIIQLTAKEVEKLGYKTIYSDTDSLFIETNLEKNKSNILGKQIESNINQFYKEYTKKNYNRESFLELQFDKQFLSMMIPKLRMQKKDEEKAAKKRYAGLVEKNGKEVLEITGLEAIRGDWTDAAREFQRELLMKAFHKEPIKEFIRNYIKKIETGKLDEKLIYRKSIRKSLDKYTKITPPHVKAARKLEKLESNIISYVITIEGPEPIQKQTHKIDYEHYIEKQIKPIANQILELTNEEFEDVSNSSKQAKLF